MIVSAWVANTSGALNRAPRMKPTVRLLVRNDAAIPSANIANPMNQ